MATMLPHRPRVADRSADLTLAQRSFHVGITGLQKHPKRMFPEYGLLHPVKNAGFHSA